MQYPSNVFQYAGPQASQAFGQSASYDYSGQDDRLKRADELANAKGKQFALLYSGDIAGSVENNHRIRDLLDAINNPRLPDVRISRTDNDSSFSLNDAKFERQAPVQQVQDGGGGGGRRPVVPIAHVAPPPAPAPVAPPAEPPPPSVIAPARRENFPGMVRDEAGNAANDSGWEKGRERDVISDPRRRKAPFSGSQYA